MRFSNKMNNFKCQSKKLCIKIYRMNKILIQMLSVQVFYIRLYSRYSSDTYKNNTHITLFQNHIYRFSQANLNGYQGNYWHAHCEENPHFSAISAYIINITVSI